MALKYNRTEPVPKCHNVMLCVMFFQVCVGTDRWLLHSISVKELMRSSYSAVHSLNFTNFLRDVRFP